MGRFLRNSSLTWCFLVLFVGSLIGNAISGWKLYNEEETSHAALLSEAPETLGFWRYVGTSDFWGSVMENWQSEYLQFTTFILLTVWLLQRGSPESKELDQVGLESDADQKLGAHTEPGSPKWAKAGGWRTRVYSNSLLIVMGTIWVLSWLGQSVTGWSEYNAAQIEHEEATVSWAGYLAAPEFWFNTFQNWQSEFLAVASMVVLAIYLRQRGSPESKPVGAPHSATGVEG